MPGILVDGPLETVKDLARLGAGERLQRRQVEPLCAAVLRKAQLFADGGDGVRVNPGILQRLDEGVLHLKDCVDANRLVVPALQETDVVVHLVELAAAREGYVPGIVAAVGYLLEVRNRETHFSPFMLLCCIVDTPGRCKKTT